MGYRIKKIILQNFKYVKADRQLEIDFNSSNLALLNGPNGYGKTTVFESIELLINGNIKSFNENLLNRGSVSKSILANDESKKIIIKAELINDKFETINICREIDCEKKFKSTITVNDNKYTQEQLEDLLRINKSIFDIAMYISQKDSLNFLGKKYKDRKSLISGILDGSNIQSKIEYLKELGKKIDCKIDDEENTFKNKVKELKEKISNIENLEKSIEKSSVNTKYKKLFNNEDYDFDLEVIDVSKSYEVYIEPVKDILKLVKNFTKYKNNKKIVELKNLIELNKALLKAIYYEEAIKDVKGKRELLENINRADELLKTRKYEYVKTLGDLVYISNDEIENIQEVVQEYNSLLKKLKDNEKAKEGFIAKRKNLIESFEENIKRENFNSNICPLCGSESLELMNLFELTEKALESNKSLIEEKVSTLRNKIEQYFENIKIKNNEIRNKNEKDYNSYLLLKEFMNIDTSNLTNEKNIMKELGFFNDTKIINEDFEEKYNIFKIRVEDEINKLGEVISEHELNTYDNLKNKYYSNSIIHSEDELNDKIAYITAKYASRYLKEKSKIETELSKKEIQLKTIKKSNKLAKDTIKTFREKYEAAFKIYQTKLVENIKIPMYINTGKIIQNYPMGIGINVDIKDNQIVFQTGNKNDDIFNYLSMGQLNGVALSLMLSVRSTVDFKDGLDLIMIDDPLQTIDDISAFSFAELLAEYFSDAQVIISTHEEDKSNLLEFKYRQHNKEVVVLNMYEKYISNLELENN